MAEFFEPYDSKNVVGENSFNMKIKAMETTQPIPTIYNDAIHEIASKNNKDELVSKMHTYDQCKTSLYDSQFK